MLSFKYLKNNIFTFKSQFENLKKVHFKINNSKDLKLIIVLIII